MKTIVVFVAWAGIWLCGVGCAYFKKESDRPWNEDLRGIDSSWFMGPGAWVNGGDSWSPVKPGLPHK